MAYSVAAKFLHEKFSMKISLWLWQISNVRLPRWTSYTQETVGALKHWSCALVFLHLNHLVKLSLLDIWYIGYYSKISFSKYWLRPPLTFNSIGKWVGSSYLFFYRYRIFFVRMLVLFMVVVLVLVIVDNLQKSTLNVRLNECTRPVLRAQWSQYVFY